MRSGKVAVFGVPSAAGARGPGLTGAPFHIREAGLLEALRATGPRVVNLSDLSLFPYRTDEDHASCRNMDVAACAARAAADEMARALAEGFVVVLGGDCSLVVGVAGGARLALGEPVGLVYLDADADLNTPETTPSGYLNGMALAAALGRGPAPLVSAGGHVPAVQPEHVALVGYRALDPGERGALGDLGLALPAAAARQLGMRVTAALALDAVENADGPVLVHLDVDILDPEVTASKPVLTSGTGLSLAELSDLLTALVASPRVVGVEVTELDPAGDPDAVLARSVVAVLARAVERRFLR